MSIDNGLVSIDNSAASIDAAPFSFGAPGAALAVFGVPSGFLWAPLARFGCPWLPLGALGLPGLPLRAQCSPFAMPVDKITPAGTRHQSHWSHWSHWSLGSGVKHCCSEPPSTRAGDDGSYTNSLKLEVASDLPNTNDSQL